MSYEVYKINIDTLEREKTLEKVKEFNWQDDIKEVFTSFDFTTTEKLSCGDWIELYNLDDKKTVFYGVIFKTSQNDINFYHYTGYDLGFYLEKNSATIQFKSETIKQAIEKLCKRYDIKTGYLEPLNHNIKNIYKNKTLSEILKDIYKIVVDKGLNDNYHFNCKLLKVDFIENKVNNDLKGYIANLYKVNSFEYIINGFEISSSIENLKNRVQVYGNEKVKNQKVSVGKIKATALDNSNIQKYGLLNHIEEVDSDKKINYSLVAEKKLKELNRITDDFSLTVIGDYNIQSGVITKIENKLINFDGYYRILKSEHKIIGTKETVNVYLVKENIN